MRSPASLALPILVACGTVAEDKTPPMITTTQPASGAEVVALSTAILVEFSEPMNERSVSLSVSPPVELAVTWPEPTTVTYTPSALLAPATRYQVTVSGADLGGNQLAGVTELSFTTGDPADETPPALVSSVPSDGATNVDPASAVVLTFSEPMARGTLAVVADPPHDL